MGEVFFRLKSSGLLQGAATETGCEMSTGGTAALGCSLPACFGIGNTNSSAFEVLTRSCCGLKAPAAGVIWLWEMLRFHLPKKDKSKTARSAERGAQPHPCRILLSQHFQHRWMKQPVKK